jgi:hypothetical protein
MPDGSVLATFVNNGGKNVLLRRGETNLAVEIAGRDFQLADRADVLAVDEIVTTIPADVEVTNAEKQWVRLVADLDKVGLVNYIHDKEARDIILHGSKEGDHPVPPGYEAPDLSQSNKPFDFDLIKTPCLSKRERARFLRVIRPYEKSFARHELDIGKVEGLEVEIDTGDPPAPPSYESYRPVPVH